MTEYAMYVFVNKELKMKPGKIAAQACHGMRHIDHGVNEKSAYVQDCYHRWMTGTTRVIALYASQEEMEELHDTYPSEKIIDAGFTQVPPNSFTVLALYPKIHDKEEFRRFKLV